MMQKLRVWNIVNPPASPSFYPVFSIAQARSLINSLADAQLCDRKVICNAFGLETLENGQWTEWHDDSGNSIDDLLETEDAKAN